MKPLLNSLSIDNNKDNESTINFCNNFINGQGLRYIFGRNEYAKSIANVLEIEGFIDDFTDKLEFLNKPIIKSKQTPKHALVVSVVIGRPFVAEKSLKQHKIQFIDYFTFKRYANINILQVKFWDEFKVDFSINRYLYEWVFNLLQDSESKKILNNIINFRLSHDLKYMRAFSDIQHRQYFENFLELNHEGETFVDVGGFDGYTSLQFIKRCQNYSSVHIFEPEIKNIPVITNNLSKYPNIHIHAHGLSNQSQVMKFESNGSASHISKNGNMEIKVERLDDVIRKQITFLKMDIEGAEMQALEGARQVITQYHPKLAICVYHRFDDFWHIPKLILSYRDDYQIFMRHYTEGVDETVMFFIPKKL